MEHILACVDPSAYAATVCDLAAWAAERLDLPVELLHVVQRKDAVAAAPRPVRRDRPWRQGRPARGTDPARRGRRPPAGRARPAAARRRRASGCRAPAHRGVELVHRHGGIVETILEREKDARVVVIGKRGASHEFASDHIGSKVERVVRASAKPILDRLREGRGAAGDRARL